MNFRREKRLKIKALFDLTPLVNVVLLLLFFFMMSGTFTVTAGIPIEAASIDGATNFEEKGLAIQLGFGDGGPENGGPVWVNDQAIDAWADLSATLKEWQEQSPGELLMIKPDARVPSERLIRVLGIANGLGIEHYVIAAKGGSGA